MTSWTARVEWEGAEPTEDEFDELIDALEGLSPAIGLDRDARPHHPTARMSAIITLEETSLRQAVAAAIKAVETATGAKAVGVEVVTTEEFDRRQAEPSFPDLVGVAEIAEILDVSRQRAAQLQVRPDFPPAIAELRSGPVRVRAQVEAWARNWSRRPGRPAAARDPVTTTDE